MKTIGLIGGISWHSTSAYYSLINNLVNQRMGGHHAAKIILYSVNYHDFKQLQIINDWKSIGIMLSEIAVRLENSGADCLLMCCNTAHIVAEDIRKKIRIPFLHIADETAREILKFNLKKVGLLGTKFTMGASFFFDALNQADITTCLPDEDDQIILHNAILNELSKGILTVESKVTFQRVIEKMKTQEVEAVIFGCTEIGLVIHQSDSVLPIFDTSVIHSKAAVDFALN